MCRLEGEDAGDGGIDFTATKNMRPIAVELDLRVPFYKTPIL